MLNRNFARFLTLSILAIAAIFSLFSQTKAQQLLTNGGFETAMVGWTSSTTHGNTTWLNTWHAGTYTVDNQSASAYSPPSFPQEGSRSLKFSFYNQGFPTNTMRLYQDFTVPSGTNLTISWKQRYSQYNATNPTTVGIITRVLIKNTSDVTLQTLHLLTLPAQTNEVRPWETMSFSLGSTYAGQTIRLEFNAIVNDSVGPAYITTRGHWELDAISALAAPPTAASASVAGRVTNSRGEGVYKVRVTATDAAGEILTTMTNPLGYYSFSVVETGQSYILQLKKRDSDQFAAQRIITPQGDLTGEDFVLDEVEPLAKEKK